jgi:uncharacterized RDD family membrane protein YckC
VSERGAGMLQDCGFQEPIDTSAEIETPEHVRFRYQLAGPARRALAYLVDTLIRGAILFGIVLVAAVGGLTIGDGFSKASTGLILLVAFAVEWGYFVLFETTASGRTPGKRAARIRVVTEGGYPLRFMDSVLRNLLRAADFLPFGYALGVAVMARDSRFRRLGDLVAGTMVVIEDRLAVASAISIDPPPTAAELQSVPDHADLSGEELEAIELLLRRQRGLAPARVDELAEMVAPLFARRLGIQVKDGARLLALLYWRSRDRRRAP